MLFVDKSPTGNTSSHCLLSLKKHLIFRLSANHHICVVFEFSFYTFMLLTWPSTSGKFNNFTMQDGVQKNKESLSKHVTLSLMVCVHLYTNSLWEHFNDQSLLFNSGFIHCHEAKWKCSNFCFKLAFMSIILYLNITENDRI